MLLCNLLLLIPATLTPCAQDEAEARAAYAALLTRHAEADALDAVATVEQRFEPVDDEPSELLIEGEVHLARPAAGWLRTSTVTLDARAGAEPPQLSSFELLGDGETIHEVDRTRRTVAALGGSWFAVFPDVSPLLAWTGRSLGEPARVERVPDPTDAGRLGLRVLRGAATAEAARSVELLWLDDAGNLVAAETLQRSVRGVRRSILTLRQWRLTDEVDPADYARKPPAGFANQDAFEEVEAAFLPIGAEAPDVTLRALAPETEDVKLDSLRGEAVLLTFWFEDCPGCAEVLPKTQALWEELSEERDDLRFLAVHLGDDPSAALAAWQAAGMTYPTLGQAEDGVSRAFGVRLYPSTYVLGKDGRVLWRSADLDPTAVRAILGATR